MGKAVIRETELAERRSSTSQGRRGREGVENRSAQSTQLSGRPLPLELKDSEKAADPRAKRTRWASLSTSTGPPVSASQGSVSTAHGSDVPLERDRKSGIGPSLRRPERQAAARSPASSDRDSSRSRPPTSHDDLEAPRTRGRKREAAPADVDESASARREEALSASSALLGRMSATSSSGSWISISPTLTSGSVASPSTPPPPPPSAGGGVSLVLRPPETLPKSRSRFWERIFMGVVLCVLSIAVVAFIIRWSNEGNTNPGGRPVKASTNGAEANTNVRPVSGFSGVRGGKKGFPKAGMEEEEGKLKTEKAFSSQVARHGGDQEAHP